MVNATTIDTKINFS